VTTFRFVAVTVTSLADRRAFRSPSCVVTFHKRIRSRRLPSNPVVPTNGVPRGVRLGPHSALMQAPRCGASLVPLTFRFAAVVVTTLANLPALS
jgi:hypothetical protein